MFINRKLPLPIIFLFILSTAGCDLFNNYEAPEKHGRPPVTWPVPWYELNPSKYPEPPQPAFDEKINITLTWPADRKGSITRPEDLLHFQDTEYTIKVEVDDDNWDEEKLNKLISDYYAYTPQVSLVDGKPNNRSWTLDYFTPVNNYPYEIIKDPLNVKKFDIKFSRVATMMATHAELRIGFVFDNPLVINTVEMPVKFYGNIDGDPFYSQKNHSFEDNSYTNVLTARFCLYHELDCPH